MSKKEQSDQIRKQLQAFMSNKQVPEEYEFDSAYGDVPGVPIMVPTSYGKGGASSYQPYQKCYKTHPPINLGNGVVIGGACAYPAPDCNIYVALDWGGAPQVYPWEVEHVPTYINYPITDMQAPKDPERFKGMISWLAEQLKNPIQIHIGCIGGHGRTGTVLAALVKEVTGNEDAITWVRENYCKKAVESAEQVNFLHKHYGITKVAGHKEYSHAPSSSTSGQSSFYRGGGWGGYSPQAYDWEGKPKKLSKKEAKKLAKAEKVSQAEGAAPAYDPKSISTDVHVPLRSSQLSVWGTLAKMFGG